MPGCSLLIWLRVSLQHPFQTFPAVEKEDRQMDRLGGNALQGGWVGGSGVWEKLLSLSLASAKLIYNQQTCGLLAPTQLCGFTLGSPAEDFIPKRQSLQRKDGWGNRPPWGSR